MFKVFSVNGCFVFGWMVLLAAMMPAVATETDLATSPLGAGLQAKPNLMFILDDSFSMDVTYMPDDIGYYSSKLLKNSRINGVAYDPSIRYQAPPKGDGTYYPEMNSENTSQWSLVPQDAYGILAASKSNLSTSGPTFYTFIPGEYCRTQKLLECVTQTAPSEDYPYPSYIRWCARFYTDATGTISLKKYCAVNFNAADTSSMVGAEAVPVYAGEGSAPGIHQLTKISPTTTSYPYPGREEKADSRTDCAASTCTYAEEMTNYANWYAYYRTRLQMAKSSIGWAFNDLDDSVRVGFWAINAGLILDVADFNAANKSKWYLKLQKIKSAGFTPLRSALGNAGRYYAKRIPGQATDPIQYACQKNYALLTTDGFWNGSAASNVNGESVGDQDSSLARPYLDAYGTPDTLADVAQYYYATDLRSPELGNQIGASGSDVASNAYANKKQNMITYSVGIGAFGRMSYQSDYATASTGDYADVANGTPTSQATLLQGICVWQTSGPCSWPVTVADSPSALDDLWHAAVNGHGMFYSAANAVDLKNGITSFLSEVQANSGAEAASTSSNVNFSSASANYVFSSKFCTSKWFGDLVRYTVNAATGALSSTPDWSQSGAGNDCAESGSSALPATPLLDKTPYLSRTVYTFGRTVNLSTGAVTPRVFAWSSLTSAMRDYFKVSAIGGLSQMCTSGSNCLSTSAKVDSSAPGTTNGAGGVNLVNYLRGDRSNEGTSSAQYYRARTHVLGDIAGSQAVYVQAPSFGYSDSGYSTFKSNQASRAGRVYVGANDGMLHAFNVGTGAEAWAYVPSMLIPKLYQLADKKYANKHTFFVDGPITTGDVYDGSSWRTILVGGLGAGGRGFYALDITSPDVPKPLWEFIHDSSLAFSGMGTLSYRVDEDMGYSFGAPVVTKLSDGTWVVLVTSGYNNISPGSGGGFLWVLNAVTGAVISKIETGLGASDTAAVGCNEPPCPSGLAKISAWNAKPTDNTVTQVYGGDLFGNLMRFDLSGLTKSGGTVGVQLLALLTDAGGTRQPITTRPELGQVNGKRVVYVATGQYLGTSDATTSQQQTLYAIKDPLTTSRSSIYSNPRSRTCSTTITTDCFVRQILADSNGKRTVTSSVSYAVDMATMRGWYEDLPETGERVNTDPTLQLGTLVFTSNIPNSDVVCAAGGTSYLNYVNYADGLTVSGAGDVGVLVNPNGTTSTPSLALTTTGQVISYTKGSDGSTTVTNIPTAASPRNTRRLSWRELAVGQ